MRKFFMLSIVNRIVGGKAINCGPQPHQVPLFPVTRPGVGGASGAALPVGAAPLVAAPSAAPSAGASSCGKSASDGVGSFHTKRMMNSVRWRFFLLSVVSAAGCSVNDGRLKPPAPDIIPGPPPLVTMGLVAPP